VTSNAQIGPKISDGCTGSTESVRLTGMVRIPAGTFLMGSEEGGEFERPVHSVFLNDYWIEKTLVTNQQFAQFVEDTRYVTGAEQAGSAWGYQGGRFAEIVGLCWRNYAQPGREDHPVVLVSWNDAVPYAKWAGRRLPTEAEWEKAARGRVDGTMYPWGNQLPDQSHCSFGRVQSDLPPTAPVREFPPNGYGLYGMVGNVWQSCFDWYGENYYWRSPSHNPTGPENGEFRVRRGGAWNVIQHFRLRCANRGAVVPSTVVPNLGFRCALSAPRA
jgi:formylglycine-generating enzyme required for sulfatase activity